MTTKQVNVSKDEGLRDGTTYEAVAGIRTAVPGGVVSAGNASQFSDGAGACGDERQARRTRASPLGIFRGFAVAGCNPDEMGIGPCVRRAETAQKRLGLSVNDIDLWELNEAFAVQVLYCADTLGILMEKP